MALTESMLSRAELAALGYAGESCSSCAASRGAAAPRAAAALGRVVPGKVEQRRTKSGQRRTSGRHPKSQRGTAHAARRMLAGLGDLGAFAAALSDGDNVTADFGQIIKSVKAAVAEVRKQIDSIGAAHADDANVRKAQSDFRAFEVKAAGWSAAWRTDNTAATKEQIVRFRVDLADYLRVVKSMASELDTTLVDRYVSGLVYDMREAIEQPELFANAILALTLPDSIRDRIVSALVEGERALGTLRATILAAQSHGGDVAAVKAQYNAAFVDHHEWKFWAMLLPIFATPLRGKVRPPSIALVKKTSSKIDLFTSIAGDLVERAKTSGSLVDALAPDDGPLGVIQLVGAAGVAAVIAAGVVAIVAIAATVHGIQAIADGVSESAAVECEKSGKCPPGTAAKLAKTHADRPDFNPLGSISNIVMWSGLGLAAIVLGPKIVDLIKSRQALPALPVISEDEAHHRAARNVTPQRPALPAAPSTQPVAGLGGKKRKRKSRRTSAT